jgi:hypothetical protein
VEQASFELPVATVPADDRAPLVRRARFLAALGLGWHLVEGAIALFAGRHGRDHRTRRPPDRVQLVDEGYAVRERQGRRNRYQVKPELPLRHPLFQEREVGELLKVLSET